MGNSFKRSIPAFLFLGGFSLGLLLWNEIRLPFSNPWGIIGPLSLIGFNPLNNLVRFVVLLSIPLILLVVLFFLKPLRELFQKKEVLPEPLGVETRKSISLGLVLVLLFYVVAISPENFPYHRDLTPLDTFHEGETLGPAEELLQGKTPYKDTIFIHGLFQDPLRSILAFKLFGESIASMRTMSSLLHLLTFFLFFLMLYLLFSKNILATLWALLLMRLPVPFLFGFGSGVPFPFFFPPRDLLPLLFVIFSILLFSRIKKRETFALNGSPVHLLFYLLSLTAMLSLFYAHDRGYFLLLASLFFFLIFLGFFAGGKRERLPLTLSILSGYISGLLVLGYFINWAFKDFFLYVFFVLPRSNGLLNEYVYDIFKTFKGIPVYMAPIFLIALNLFWLFHRFLMGLTPKEPLRKKLRAFLGDYYLELLLLVLSLLYYRGALGRSDLGHIHYYAGFAIILTTYIFLKHYLFPYLSRRFKRSLVLSSFFLFILFFVPLSLFRFHENLRKGSFTLPLGTPDSLYIPDNYKATIAFLKENIGDDGFVTLTSEGVWYYFLRRPSPTRFPVVFLASPSFYQEEFVGDLERKKVKYVLYRNSSPWNIIDGIPNETRLPIIFNYVKDRYRFYKKIDDQELWIRRSKEEEENR